MLHYIQVLMNVSVLVVFNLKKDYVIVYMHVLFRNFSAISQDGMRTTISYLFLMLVQRGYFGLGINYLLPGLHLACDVSTGPMSV